MRTSTPYKSLAFGSVVLLGGVIAILVFGQTAKWVGHTDLEIRFVVTDAETDQPIPNASILIKVEAGDFCDDPPQPEFTITTDDNGHATQLTTDCMCYGAKSIVEDSFAMHVPDWSFQATAAGYSATAPESINLQEYSQAVRRGRPFATLSIPLRLRRNVAQ